MRIFLLIISSVLFLGCSSIDPVDQFSQINTSELRFNVEGGKYQMYELRTWRPEGKDCFEFTIVEPNYDIEWLPGIKVIFGGETEIESVGVTLSEMSRGSKLEVEYDYPKNKIREVMKTHINYGEPVKIGFMYPSDTSISIHIDGEVFHQELGFTPIHLDISGSSSKSVFKLMNIDQCIWD